MPQHDHFNWPQDPEGVKKGCWTLKIELLDFPDFAAIETNSTIAAKMITRQLFKKNVLGESIHKMVRSGIVVVFRTVGWDVDYKINVWPEIISQ